MEQQTKTSLEGLSHPKEPELDTDGIPYYEDGDWITEKSLNGLADNIRKNKDDISELKKDNAENKDDISYLVKLITNILLNISGILDVCKDEEDSMLRLQEEVENLQTEVDHLRIALMFTLIIFVLGIILFMLFL